MYKGTKPIISSRHNGPQENARCCIGVIQYNERLFAEGETFHDDVKLFLVKLLRVKLIAVE